MRKRQRERSPLSTLLQQLSLFSTNDPVDQGLANSALQPYVHQALAQHTEANDLLRVLEQYGWRDGRFADELCPDRLFSALHLYTYERIEHLGSGAYATVYKARNRETHEICAVKKMRLQCGEGGVPSTAIREVSCLQDLRHENIVELRDVLWNSQKGSMYVVLECLDKDLRTHLNTFQSAPPIHLIKRYTRQLLRAMTFAHARRVMHRDLKPQNILVDAARDAVKVADFGLARTFLPAANKVYSHEVVTLWYRAPELLLGTNQYSAAVDVWSIGCILAEMLNFLPIFTADSEIGMLHQIFQALGTPSADTWPSIHALPYFRTTFPRWPARPLAEVIPSLAAEPDAADLLSRLLTLDPSRRLTATQALDHPWLREAPQPAAEPSPTDPLTPITPAQMAPEATPSPEHPPPQPQHASTPVLQYGSPSPYPKLRVPRRTTPSPRPAPPPLHQLLSSHFNAIPPASCPAALAAAAALRPPTAPAGLPPLPASCIPAFPRTLPPAKTTLTPAAPANSHPPPPNSPPTPPSTHPDTTAATTGSLSSLRLHASSPSQASGSLSKPPSSQPQHAPFLRPSPRKPSRPSETKPPLPPLSIPNQPPNHLPFATRATAIKASAAAAKLATPTPLPLPSPQKVTLLARRSQHKTGPTAHASAACASPSGLLLACSELSGGLSVPQPAAASGLRLKLPQHGTSGLGLVSSASANSCSSSLMSSPDQISLQDLLHDALQDVQDWE